MAQADARKTFVLIHGAWHGGWCWRRVADILEQHGHKVYAPSLTGNGDRSHLLSKDVILDTHIADIVNLVKWEDLNGYLPRRAFLWRLAGLGRARADPRSRRSDRLARRVQAGERPEGHRLRVGLQPQGAGGGRGQGRARPQGPAGKDVFAEREGLRLDRLQADPAAERRRDPADRAHRQARDHREEDLHSRAEISASGFRQGAGRVQGRPTWQTFVNDDTGHDS